MDLFKPNVEKMEKKNDVNGLIKALKHKDKNVRMGAAKALGKIGDARAVEPLIEALKDQDSFVRRTVAEALGDMHDARVIEPLIEALKDMNDKDVQNEAERALGKIGEPAVEPLIQALTRDPWWLRWKAAEVLRKIGDKRATEPLIQALKDKDRNVQLTAAKALGKIGDARAVEPLIQSLENLDLEGMQIAGKALVRIGGPTVKPLIRVLQHTRSMVRTIVAEALDELGWKPRDHTEKAYYLIAKGKWKELTELGKPAVEPLIQTLKDKDWDVRRAAAQALGKIADTRAVEPLIQTFKDNWGIQEAAALALGEIGDLRAAEMVVNWLFRPGDPSTVETPSELDSWIHAMSNLFGNYAPLIIKASMCIKRTTVSKGRKDTYWVDYDIQHSDEAIHGLCVISTQISNNILHRALQRKDITVEVSCICGDSYHNTLSFKSQREMAREELKRRGDPPYDPSAYLDREAWKL